MHPRSKYKKSLKQLPNDTIAKENIKVSCSNSGINIFCNGNMITKDPGLNVAVNTLGIWTDSTKADWHIIEKGNDYFRISAVFRYIPLEQIWSIKIKDGQRIHWQIDMAVEEGLHIDEFRILSIVNPQYKTWVTDYKHVDFPRSDNNWHDLYLDNRAASLVGAIFPIGDQALPSFVLEVEDKNMLPIIQNTPLDLHAHIIGFRHIDSEEKKDYLAGEYDLFSGRINLFEKGVCLDEKVEDLRQDYLWKVKKEKEWSLKQKGKLKTLLVNLPWQNKDRVTGVRAGSRWPHIKDSSEGNYLPFPFFLAYTTSLLRKNGIEVDLIDAIAEEIPVDEFTEDLSRRDFDILVVETSVPSFYYDMDLLKKLSSAGSTIVLCGPHPEAYKEAFLTRNNFIDFVLFGEYEFTLLELIRALQDGRKDLSSIKGLIWRDNNNRVIKNLPQPPFDINLLPWPYRDSVPMDRYWDLPGDIPHPSAQLVASRGCPFSCNFCLWPQVLFGGKTYRTRDVNDVVDEMEYLIKDKGFKSLYFDDDTFNIGKNRITRLCNKIIKRGLHKTPWAVMAKADLMDDELLKTMREAGLHAVKYGVENVSQELVDRCGKCLDLAKTERIIKTTKSLGIRTHLTFAFGLPGETKETIKRTIDYALRLDSDSIQFSIITPFPGTTLFEELDSKGKILTKDWSLYDGHHSCIFQPDNLSPADLEEAKQCAYRMWADYKRKKRGFSGDVKRFFNYCQSYGIKGAFGKTGSYLNYLLFHKRKFIGKI